MREGAREGGIIWRATGEGGREGGSGKFTH